MQTNGHLVASSRALWECGALNGESHSLFIERVKPLQMRWLEAGERFEFESVLNLGGKN